MMRSLVNRRFFRWLKQTKTYLSWFSQTEFFHWWNWIRIFHYQLITFVIILHASFFSLHSWPSFHWVLCISLQFLMEQILFLIIRIFNRFLDENKIDSGNLKKKPCISIDKSFYNGLSLLVVWQNRIQSFCSLNVKN